MENFETLLNNISNDIGGNNNKKNLYLNKVSVAKSQMRMRRLDQDYQETYEKYSETRENWHRYYDEARRPKHRNLQAVLCISYYQRLLEHLQNILDKLNKVESTQRGPEKHDHSKQFSMLYGRKTLAQEKFILQQVVECQPLHIDNLSQETFQYKRINMEFNYYQGIIPKSSSKKPIHDLLRRVKETKKLTKIVIANGELVENPTSQSDLTISIKNEMKLLATVIKKLQKERLRETVYDKGYKEKMRLLEKKCESISAKRDEEKKYMLRLKKDT